MSTILQTTATRTIHPERILNYTAKSMFLLREVAIHCTISFKSEASTRMESHLLCGCDFQKYCILPSDSILVEASDLNEMVQ
jgi:hypothetical protein